MQTSFPKLSLHQWTTKALKAVARLFVTVSLLSMPGLAKAVEWNQRDLKNRQESIERELEAGLLQEFPEIANYSERERVALFYAFIAQDQELTNSLNLSPSDFGALREGRRELTVGEIEKLNTVAMQAFERMSRELRIKLKQLKLPISLPAQFAIEGVKGTIALNIGFLSGLAVTMGMVPEGSDIAAGLKTLTVLSAVYLAALPLRLPRILQNHYEKLEAVKAAQLKADRTHQIPAPMKRLWYLSKELKLRLKLAEAAVSGGQCSLLFISVL